MRYSRNSRTIDTQNTTTPIWALRHAPHHQLGHHRRHHNGRRNRLGRHCGRRNRRQGVRMAVVCVDHALMRTL